MRQEETPDLILSGVRGPSEKPGRGLLPGAQSWTLRSRAVRAAILLSKPPVRGVCRSSPSRPGQDPRECTQPSAGTTCSRGFRTHRMGHLL